MGEALLDVSRESLERCLRTYLHPAHALWRAIELALIAQRRPLLQGRILDLGCGDGTFGRMVFGDRPITGVDRRDRELALARRNCPQAALLQADACSLPFAAESFDTVFSNCVLEHIPDLDRCLDETARVLRPGGHFLFTVPSPRFAPLAELNRKLEMLHFLSVEQWRERLGRRALTVVQAVGYLSPGTFAAWKRLHEWWEFGRTRGVPPLSLPFLLLPGGGALHARVWRRRFARLLQSDAPQVSVAEPYALLVVARKQGAY